jgi:hypothetical protein
MRVRSHIFAQAANATPNIGNSGFGLWTTHVSTEDEVTTRGMESQSPPCAKQRLASRPTPISRLIKRFPSTAAIESVFVDA